MGDVETGESAQGLGAHCRQALFPRNSYMTFLFLSVQKTHGITKTGARWAGGAGSASPQAQGASFPETETQPGLSLSFIGNKIPVGIGHFVASNRRRGDDTPGFER